MINIFGSTYRHCDGISRREILRAGALGVAGLTLADLLRAEAAAGAGSSSKAVINIHLDGGPSHQDMIDLKPEAPAEVRGEFSPIPTVLPGFQVCELLPKIASIADRIAFIRSLVGSAGHHHAVQTQGGLPAPEGDRDPVLPLSGPPSMGAILAKLYRQPTDQAPTYVDMMGGRPFARRSARPGYLGPSYSPFRPDVTGQFGAQATDGLIEEARRNGVDNGVSLQPPEGLTKQRLRDRADLRTSLSDIRRQFDKTGALGALDGFTEQACNILTSGQFARAMDLAQEEPTIREKYMPEESLQEAGKLLLARRMIEAGVRCVSTSFSEYDTHGDNFPTLRKTLPVLDHALFCLITDLEERGMLDDVSIVVWGEFGRTPRIQGTGRNHWPPVGMAMLAGGGIRAGQVLGKTDKHAGYAVDRPVHFKDIFATLYYNLGIDPVTTTVLDAQDRPHRLLDRSAPIEELV